MSIAAEKYFSFDNVAKVLSDWGKSIEWSENGISWTTSFGNSEIIFVSGEFFTTDGLRIMGHVECRHWLSGGSDEPMGTLDVASWNKLASLSALFPGTKDDSPMVLARTSIFEGDDAAVQNLYTPMIATEAFMQPHLFAAIAENRKDQGPAYFQLARGFDEPPYYEDDFQKVKELYRSQGLYSNNGSNGVVAEFPYDPGSISALLSFFGDDKSGGDQLKRTSLCKLTTEESHPHLGRGLLATLQLPFDFGDLERNAQLAVRLNQFEATSADMPPFMGAWCVGAGGVISYVMFVPNELCYPGLPSNIAVWLAHRARRVPRWFEDLYSA